MDIAHIREILESARNSGRTALLETEGIALLSGLGFTVPRHRFIRSSSECSSIDLDGFEGERVVVKVISPEILHKSDVGGVAVVDKSVRAVKDAVSAMERSFAERSVEGYTVHQFVSYDPSLGNELLLGVRWTKDFGPVVVFGAGGIYTEYLADTFKTGTDVAIVSPRVHDPSLLASILDRVALMPLLRGGLRGQQQRMPEKALLELFDKAYALADAFLPDLISEFEINPLVVSNGTLVALDVLVKLSEGEPPLPPARPLHKLKNLLEPESAAVIGVSEKMNPGHIILNNLIREGFDRERIYVVKPNLESIEGCRCVPDIASLPEKVDLLVLSVSASQVPETVSEIIEQQKAESLIVIPGGLEEKEGTEELITRMHRALLDSRASDWGGPLINGGNCLGIRSLPGKYDTLFIPPYKLDLPTGAVSPVAFICQSGAFAISKGNKLPGVNPKYTITMGNQTDLTVGDYLSYLKNDPSIGIYAVYVEGFKPMDGLRFLEAAREITASGRTVILYRAGRTAAGAKASQSHTASIAGDYAVTRELALNSGILVADSLADFEDLIKLFTYLDAKEVAGWRLGALSNAGFESVAMADNLGNFTLAEFNEGTAGKLLGIFEKARIAEIVDVHNPLDLTPMMNDAGYDAVIRAMLEDDNVDAGIVGCVPLTPALSTLAPGDGHREDVYKDTGIASRMKQIMTDTRKAWVAVIDGGAIYDPLAHLLDESGIPTFRTADRALRLFHAFCDARLRTKKHRE